ncbi:VOC family protein [Candidatus Bathyarchaeota archaeon]|nr:MAG: VOC family protein [Candidatus Bathyarchaeota archaeon]
MGSRARKSDRPGSMASLGIGHVGLKVDDLETSVEFYRNILGLHSSMRERGVARIPSGRDTLVLHEKGLGLSGFHFGFRVDSSSKVDEWQAWLRGANIVIYEDVTEEKYRSIKIKDPNGYLIEIFHDERGIAE